MAFDVKGTLTDLGFSEAEVAELEPKFAGERAKKLEGMVLRQADYSRQMNELGKAKKDLADANERLNAEIADWGSTAALTKKQLEERQTALEAAQQEKLRLTQVVTRLSSDAGLNPDDVLKGITTAPPPEKPKAPEVDLSGVVPKDQFTQFARSALHLPAELDALRDEHQELFGKRLDTRTIIAEIEARASTRNNQKSLNPRDIWEEMHGVSAKRTEVAEATRQADLKAAEERGYERARTEQALPGQAPPGRHSPAFRAPDGKPRESVLHRPQPGQRLQGAVAALANGTYRQKT